MMRMGQPAWAGCGCSARRMGAVDPGVVNALLQTGTQITNTVLDNVPALQRSQVERLAKQKRKLMEERSRASTRAQREAIQAEIDAIDFQLGQYVAAAEQAAGGPLVVERPASANIGAIALGGLLIAAVVGGAVYFATRD
jgi:hypothetical protein